MNSLLIAPNTSVDLLTGHRTGFRVFLAVQRTTFYPPPLSLPLWVYGLSQVVNNSIEPIINYKEVEADNILFTRAFIGYDTFAIFGIGKKNVCHNPSE